MNATTLRLAGYQSIKQEKFEETMSKAHYTLQEVHLYHEDIKDQETKLARTTEGSDLNITYKDTLHVMLEVYARMQENLRDFGPRKADTRRFRLFKK